MPLVRPMGKGLFEVRTGLSDGSVARVLFCFHEGLIYALHGFIKKARKTPSGDLQLAWRRMKEVEYGERQAAKNRHRGSSLDDFLVEDGVLPEFQARAIKEVVAWQLAEAMKERGLSKAELARLMRTSRTQVDRVLDPANGNVTIETLQRAAQLVGRRLQLELA